ncbi:hypothetical protein IFM46972_08300, partial [Aspergillus udagawae]
CLPKYRISQTVPLTHYPIPVVVYYLRSKIWLTLPDYNIVGLSGYYSGEEGTSNIYPWNGCYYPDYHGGALYSYIQIGGSSNAHMLPCCVYIHYHCISYGDDPVQLDIWTDPDLSR